MMPLMTNEWMNDPSLQEIAPYKLQFLQALIFESASLSREQMMPFLMAVMKRGKEKNINFLFEASCGGGIPIIRALNGSLTAGIPVHCQCS